LKKSENTHPIIHLHGKITSGPLLASHRLSNDRLMQAAHPQAAVIKSARQHGQAR
jgi:hypothetical protein